MQPVPGHACLIISEVQDLSKMTEKIRPTCTYEAWPKEEKQLPVSVYIYWGDTSWKTFLLILKYYRKALNHLTNSEKPGKYSELDMGVWIGWIVLILYFPLNM